MQTHDVRDVKRLYLSGTYFVKALDKRLRNYVGNAIKSGFFEEHCYNLVYLELAACRLTALPEELARLVPNLRVLNLNYNFLEDVGPLEGLTRLRKLSLIGSRVRGTKALIRMVQRMPDAEVLDFRQVRRLCGDWRADRGTG
jgi:Leucine-rich repeat (LRR) protein